MSAPEAAPRDLLRFATAGSIDDGRSAPVGRLLYDTESVPADQIEAVQRASVDKGLSTPNLSLLVDGLLADTPGHVQCTRNPLAARLVGAPLTGHG